MEKDQTDYAAIKALNILIAEDDDSVTNYLNALLKHKSNRLYFAENGEEAMEMIQKHSDIDLVLMDLKMPFLDGFKATENIRKMNITVPIIAQTGSVLNNEEEKAMKAGCSDFIAKPINKTALFNLILKHTGN